jgi:phosphatidylserine synthase
MSINTLSPGGTISLGELVAHFHRTHLLLFLVIELAFDRVDWVYKRSLLKFLLRGNEYQTDDLSDYVSYGVIEGMMDYEQGSSSLATAKGPLESHSRTGILFLSSFVEVLSNLLSPSFRFIHSRITETFI